VARRLLPRNPKTLAQSEEALAKKIASAKKKTGASAVKDAAAAKKKKAVEARKGEAQEQKAAKDQPNRGRWTGRTGSTVFRPAPERAERALARV
jgi:septal ring factor EnvC (AmiA/AmiB activator)